MRRDPLTETDEDADADSICVVSIARRVCGPAVAQKIVLDFGGTRLFVPRQIGLNHPLAKSIGIEAATNISSECFGVSSYVPMNIRQKTARRRALVQLLAEEGKSRDEIAGSAGCSNRSVYRDIAALRLAGAVIHSKRNGKANRR